MMLGQFEYRYRDVKPGEAVWNQLPDMGVWKSLRLKGRVDSYVDRNVSRRLMREHRSLMADLQLARSFGMYRRADELSRRVRELSDGYLRFSAAEFFTEHCGWAWGGASLEWRDVSYVSGDYVLHGDYAPADVPVVCTVHVPVAVMDVYRCGNRICIPVVGAAVESLGDCAPLPEAVPDVLLFPVLRGSVLTYVLFSGYTECGRGILLGDGDAGLLAAAAKNTERYLTGELYRAAEESSRRAWLLDLERAAADRQRRMWRDSIPEKTDWDNEAETLEAMGYDSDVYVHDRDSWMYW